ncbi:protein-glutamine gamma-glutamyltransferase [Paenibacillus silvisoli]|uniref:protein-glutamine gamma-glutamyltransferase n=1 Tax=Paenibacillus silvisoli TaxID=3110539 RepID=UPI002803D460|nr:protein-glutamine gamma-glutamyltransferase [Paenibacillus silvisoli]
MQFESTLRSAIIKAARAMNRGKADFATFRTSFCNPEFWILTNEGGFRLRDSVTPAEGIQDIFANGNQYGFECATAIIIVLYKGVLDALGEETFNKLFPKLHLYSWQHDSDLALIQKHDPSANAQPGDVLYFKNPEVDPETMEWRGENVIKISDDLYFGHGIGIKSAEGIIASLNKHRAPEATETAYLEDQFLYPDFNALSKYAPADERPSSRKAAIIATIGERRYVLH